MGLETVIEEILARGREEADAIRKSAEADRERFLQEAKVEGAKLLAAREQEARIAAERSRIQELARAELESKRTVLAAQKQVLDEVYSKALQRLAELPDRDVIVRALLNTNVSEWRAGKVYASQRDAEQVRAIVGPNYAGPTEALGGVVIESEDGARKTDLRFETLFADVWRDSVREVAEILWPKL